MYSTDMCYHLVCRMVQEVDSLMDTSKGRWQNMFTSGNMEVGAPGVGNTADTTLSSSWEHIETEDVKETPKVNNFWKEEAIRNQTHPPEDKYDPSHYQRGKIQVWDFIADQKLDFFKGNVVKYVCRAGTKSGESELDDLMKAKVYVEKAIELLAL